MKPGDKEKVTNYKDDSHQIMTVIKVLEESVELKHPTIGGFFIVSRNKVVPLFCQTCECDPCDCDWGIE